MAKRRKGMQVSLGEEMTDFGYAHASVGSSPHLTVGPERYAGYPMGDRSLIGLLYQFHFMLSRHVGGDSSASGGYMSLHGYFRYPDQVAFAQIGVAVWAGKPASVGPARCMDDVPIENIFLAFTTTENITPGCVFDGLTRLHYGLVEPAHGRIDLLRHFL
ncbi:hypothetical protein D9M71_296000 [compost metagenome]